METPSGDPRPGQRAEEDGRRDEALLLALQGQLDELRQAQREQAQRQGRVEDQARALEGQVAQARAEAGAVRQEIVRLTGLRGQEEQRQIAELLGQLDSVRAEIARAGGAARQAHEGQATLQQAQVGQARDLQRLSDQAHLVEQEGRRRMVEVEGKLADLGGRIDQLGTHRPMLEEALRRTRQELATFQPQLDALAQRAKEADAEQSRIEAQAHARDARLGERLEEARATLARATSGVDEATAAALGDLRRRLEAREVDQRDLEGRLGGLRARLDDLEQADARLLEALRRSEERLVRRQLEQAQQAWEELAERRQREAEEESGC